MTNTPLNEQTPPTILPVIVAGTMSPYLYTKREKKKGETNIKNIK